MLRLNIFPACRRVNLSPLPFAFLFAPMILVTGIAAAQPTACTPVQIDETVAAIHHRAQRPEQQDIHELQYLMKAEHTDGRSPFQVAVIQVDVNTEGKVTAATPISGLHALSKLIIDQLERSSYIPFKENGQAVCAEFKVWVVQRGSFDPPESAGRKNFNTLLQKCIDLSRGDPTNADLVATCQQAADAGNGLPAAYFARDKRLAYVTTATALLRANRTQGALPYAEKAVGTADLGFDDVSGKATAYAVRGQARGLTGDLKGANEDLTKAEDLERATFDVPRKPEQIAFDTHALRSMLGFHAEVLSALHEKPQADKLRDEAKKL